MNATTLRVSLLSLLLLPLTGCDREESVRTYSEPKSTEVAQPITGATGAGAPAGPARAGGFEWKLPEGWTLESQPRPMREATAYTPGDADSRAEVVVSRLGAQFGDLAGNINRWRGQVELPPLEGAPAGETLKLPAGEGTLYTLEGPQRAQLVAHLPAPGANWFFKLIGPREQVQKHRTEFLKLLETVKVE
jgi:hypothetical protein